MGETERFTIGRQPGRRAGRASAEPAQDGTVSRRLIEPLDESGGPLIEEPKVSGQGVDVQLEEKIRVRAYERYLERQGRPGCPESDWLEAEREVRSTSWSARQQPKAPPPAI